MMPYPVQDQLVSELARDLVGQTAPQELALFRPVSEAYFKDPDRALKGQPCKDEALGFGVAEAAIFITPIVLAVMTDVLKYLGEHVLQTVKEESSGLASDEVKHLFKKFRTENSGKDKDDTENASRVLAPEQIVQVRGLAFEKARELHLATARANLLADSLAGSLAVAS
jgi:hypothetical protein